MKLPNIQSRAKSFTEFLVSGGKKTGSWLERNGANLAYVIGFTTCLVGAFWATATAPLPVAIAVLSLFSLVSLAETVD